MTAALIVLAVVNAGAVVATLLYGLRNAGLREENRALADQLVVVGGDFARYRRTSEAQLAAVRKGLKTLEASVDRSASPDVVRDELNRLFAKASSRGDDENRAVPEPATAAARSARAQLPSAGSHR